MLNKKHDDHAPLYDVGMKVHWFGRYNKFRHSIIENFGDFRDTTILDFGCGTGLLLEFMKANYSYTGCYLGLDSGYRMLRTAKEKDIKHDALLFMQLSEAVPYLPIKESAIDIVCCCLVTHQISHDNKLILFKEMYRVLKPNGKIVMTEFCKPYTIFGKYGALYIKYIWGKIIPDIALNITDNLEGNIPAMLEVSGFSELEVTGRWKGFVATIAAIKR
ncbi:MAG: class I SAM-dependent methyltransferase [bacterium]